MKKIIATLAFLCVAAGGALGQTGLLDVKRYEAYFGIDKRDISRKYVDVASDDDYERFSVLGGDITDIDTPLEFAILSYYSQPVLKIRPKEADAILPANNPKLADQKLGAAVFQEIQVLRFLGDTAAVNRHEAILQYITNRKNVTRAEIETYYRNNIRALVSETVDVEFKKTRGGYVPYDVYVNSGYREIIEGIKDIITQFYLDPNANTYMAIVAIAKHFNDQISRGFSFALHVVNAYADALGNLSPELLKKIDKDLSSKTAIPAEVLNNPTVKRVTQNVTLKFN
jgi:hypothetical protein